MTDLKRHLNSGLIETLIVLYVVTGSLTGIGPINKLFYVIGLVAEILALFHLLNSRYADKKILKCYLEIMATNVLITFGFILGGTSVQLVFSRSMSLICIFGCIIFFVPELKVDLFRVLIRVKKVMLVIAAIMLFDIICNKLTGLGIWKPITYLGYRYSGPFYDSNYAAAYMGCILLLVWTDGDFDNNKKWIATLILGANIYFCGSLTSILALFICLIATVLKKMIPINRVIVFHLICLGIYVAIIMIWSNNRQFFYEIGTGLLGKIYPDGGKAKYISLQIRFETQYKALRIAALNFWGQGPHQLVPQLGHDTHNSFFSFFFEEGYLGLLLLLQSLRYQAPKITNFAFYLVLFITINIFLLDIHYTTIYTILLISIQIGRHRKSARLLYEEC